MTDFGGVVIALWLLLGGVMLGVLVLLWLWRDQ